MRGILIDGNTDSVVRLHAEYATPYIGFGLLCETSRPLYV
jgi:hypothetical protein